MREAGTLCEPVHCRTRAICVLLTLTVFPLLTYGPLIASLAATYFFGFSPGTLVLVASCAVLAWFLTGQMSQNYHWVELDGSHIRGKKLLSRRMVEATTDEITAVVPMQAVVQNTTNYIVDRVLNSSIRGFEIRLNNGEKIALVRYDMKGFDEFILALNDVCPEWFHASASRR